MKNYYRLKLTSNALFTFSRLWGLALALRMGAPAIELFLGARPHWLKWIYYIPRAWPKDENARWFKYWPMLLPLAVVLVASVFQGINKIKTRQAERIYHHENHN